jgi:hypothetical protein
MFYQLTLGFVKKVKTLLGLLAQIQKQSLTFAATMPYFSVESAWL